MPDNVHVALHTILHLTTTFHMGTLLCLKGPLALHVQGLHCGRKQELLTKPPKQ